MKNVFSKHKYLIEIIVFCLLLSVIVYFFYDTVRYKNVGSGGGMDNFYETKVPIDVMVYGSSHAACTVNNGQLWEDAGIASFTLSAGGQGIDGTYFFLRESIAHNKPKVALVETFLFPESLFSVDGVYRSALTSRFSPRYVSYISDLISTYHIDREEAENLLLRLPIVHSRYSELEENDYHNDEPYMRGYRGDNMVDPQDPPRLTNERGYVTNHCFRHIDMMMELCKKNGVELVFFNAPYSAGEEAMAAQNAIMDYVNEHGGTYLGLNHNYEELGLDFERDYRDDGHLNDSGAAKVTKYLENYLLENYDLPDRRGQAGYEAWDEHVEFLADKTDGYELESCTESFEYFEKLSEIQDKFMIMLSFNGNYDALGEQFFLSDMEVLGIDEEAYTAGGAYVLQNGGIILKSEGAEEYSAHMEVSNKHDLVMFKSADEEFGHIRLANTDYSADCNGISIVVYDPRVAYVVDSAYINVYEGTRVERLVIND